MGSAKPLASLSSGLLARKGQAKPAMRPQVFNPVASLDDLGWNDMGAGEPQFEPRAEPQPLPPVLAQREELAAAIETVEPEPKPEPQPSAPPPLAAVRAARISRDSAAQTAKGKAAFTLRLDAARHLRLRLASAVADRSAQALVAEALDRFIAQMPEVEALAAQLPMKKA